jgi:hypothetical protein
MPFRAMRNGFCIFSSDLPPSFSRVEKGGSLTLASLPEYFVSLSAFNRAVVAMVLALSIGVQWPLLQSIAWLNMLVTFSAQDGIQTAVVKTFDGKHPCKLCNFVSEGKQAEKKKDATQQSLKKFDLLLVTAADLSFPREPFFPHSDFQPECRIRPHAPLSPPPDLA